MKVWAEIFELPAYSPHIQDWAVEAVLAFRAEINHTRSQLDIHGVPQELTSSVFVGLKDWANPATADHQWGQTKANISGPQFALVLSWSVWVLQKFGEPEIEQHQFESIQKHLSELEELLKDNEIPPAIRSFVQQQVDTTRNALRMYPIQGVRALRKAVESATGAFAVPSDELVEEAKQATPATRGVIKKSLEVLKETSEAVGHAEKLFRVFDKLMDATPSLKEIGHSVMNTLGGGS